MMDSFTQSQWFVQQVQDFKQTKSPNQIHSLQENLAAATPKDEMEARFTYRTLTIS